MKLHALRTVSAGFAVLLFASLSRGQNPAREALPFVPGETLTYQLSWQIFPAGQIDATLSSVGQGPDDAYQVTARAKSHGFVSILFPVNDVYISNFDPQSLCSRRISKTINEGRHHRDTTIVFDSARRLAILDERDLTRPEAPPKHAENEMSACTEDIVTAFYYVRGRPLVVGEKFHVSINDGSKTRDVLVDVQAREQVHTLMGNRMALRVEPTVFGGLFRRKGRMLIWFSDDAQHLPLRIKAMLNIGTISADLRSVSGEAPKAAAAPAQAPSPRK